MAVASKNSHYWDSMYKMRLSGSLCDIQLCVKDDMDNVVAIPAHKNVLIASSLYFSACLEKNSLQDVYNFDGVSLPCLQKVLDYIYRQIQWSELVETSEAEAIASTLKVVKHEPFDAPSHGCVFRNPDGTNIVFIEKIKHSSKKKSNVNSASNERQSKSRKSNTKIFHSENELNEALAMHNMRPKTTGSQEKSDERFQATRDGEERVDLQTIVTVPLEEVEQGGEEAVMLENVYGAEVNIGEEEEVVVQLQQQQQQQHQEQQDEDSQQSQEQQQQQPLSYPESETETQVVEAVVLNPGDVVRDIKVEKEFPGASKMDLLASASEMVQRQDLNAKSDTRNDANTQAISKTESNTRPGAKSDANSEPNFVIYNAPSSESVKEKASEVKEECERTSHSESDAMKEDEGSQTSKSDGTEETGRRSRRIAKRKDVLQTYVTPTKRKKKDEMKKETQPPETASITEEEEEEKKDDSQESQEENVEKEKEAEEEIEEVEEKKEKSEDQDKMDSEEDIDEMGVVFEVKIEKCDESPGSGRKDIDIAALRQSIRVVKPRPDEGENSFDSGTLRRKRGRPSLKGKEEQKKTEFYCEKCNKYFVNLTGYKNHVSYSHLGVKVHPQDGRSYDCTYCSQTFSTFAAAATHMRMTHPDSHREEGYVCPNCPAENPVKFKYHKELKLHMVREHDMELWFCELCQKSFHSQEGHKIHMFKQHSGAPASNICDQCGKGFVREAELRSHQRVTHSEARAYQCQVCAAAGHHNAFKTNNALRRHIHTVHTSTRDFYCDVCNSCFKTKNDMQRHREKHYRPDNPMPADGARKKDAAADGGYLCKLCNKAYKNASSLATHQRVQHVEKDDTVSYMCTFCNKSFAVKQYLLMHLRNIHEPKKYKCDGCSLTFAQRYEVKRHQPKCRGYQLANKPYSCVQCGKSFTLKGNLTKHLATSCKGRRKENSVDYVLMMHKEEEVAPRHGDDQDLDESAEGSPEDSNAYTEEHGYIVDPMAAEHIAGHQEIVDSDPTKVVMVAMETKDDSGKTVFRSVPLQSLLEAEDQGGLEIIHAEEEEVEEVEGVDGVQGVVKRHYSKNIVLKSHGGDVMEIQGQGDIVEMHGVVAQTHEDVVTMEYQVDGDVVEVEHGYEMEGNVMYEVSGEEIVGVTEALERQGIQVTQAMESQ